MNGRTISWILLTGITVLAGELFAAPGNVNYHVKAPPGNNGILLVPLYPDPDDRDHYLELPTGTKLTDCRSLPGNCGADPQEERRARLSYGMVRVHYDVTSKGPRGKSKHLVGEAWVETQMLRENAHINLLPNSLIPERGATKTTVISTEPCCNTRKDEVSKRTVDARELKERSYGLVPQIFFDDVNSCPAGPRDFSFSDHDFSIHLQRFKAKMPMTYSNKITPFNVSETEFIPTPEEPAKTLCEIKLTKGCGPSTVSRIDKLLWLTGELKKMGEKVCQAGAESFYRDCGLWRDKDPDERRDLVMKYTTEAVHAFHPSAEAGSQNYKSARSSVLSPELTQCLFHRESPKFEPNKLNYSLCQPAPKQAAKKHSKKTGNKLADEEAELKKVPSTANGLVHVVGSTVKDFWDREDLRNYCKDFAQYWDERSKENASPGTPRFKCTPAFDGDDLFGLMSESPELQIAVGTWMINRFLVFNHDNIHAALLRWFATEKDHAPEKVMDCMKCMKQKSHDADECLSKTNAPSKPKRKRLEK